MVRLQVQDLAGNAASAQTDVTNDNSNSLALTSSPPPLAAPPSPPPPASQANPPRPPTPPVESPFPTQNWQRNPVESAPPPRLENQGYRPPETAMRMPSAAPPPPAAPVEEPAGPRVIARSNVTPAPTWTGAPPASPAPGHTALPAPMRAKAPGPSLQYTNQLHVDLNYEISRVGPSGVGEVQLWVTQDDGRTWRRFADDTDLEPPFGIDLPGEGAYGFSLVIRSRGGLYKNGKQAPQPGDVPELRLEVDTTAPEAVLYAVEADPRRKDVLFLLWNASDRNLAPKPISLRWAEKPNGPWQDIAVDVPNTNRHEWQMPANLPYRVYLRLEARDLAGNVCAAETPEPVLVDLTEPEGMLKGLVVMPPAPMPKK